MAFWLSPSIKFSAARPSNQLNRSQRYLVQRRENHAGNEFCKWLEEYPAIAKRAKSEGGEIHWGDETALVNTDVRGRGYAPKGQTPVAYAPGSRQKLSLISTVTNQGKARWMIIDDVFNADRLIEFLEALIKDAGDKIFLILHNLRVRHSKPVKAWLADHSGQIEIFYLPSYSPELNPDERLNADLKQPSAQRLPSVQSPSSNPPPRRT